MTSVDMARELRGLHREGTFVLPNAWDVASALLMEASGAKAVATTSSGLSWAAGVPDGGNLTREENVAMTARIAEALRAPLSADMESGYGPTPDDVSSTVAAVIGAGAVGMNLEDRPGPNGEILWPVDLQCERLSAARATADEHLRGFVLNARTDVFLAAVGEPDEREDAVLERAERYAESGADCLFVPGLTDLATIGRIADRCPLPVNILLAAGTGPTISQLASAGVRRISVGGSIARAVAKTVSEVVAALMTGDDRPLRNAMAHHQMQELLSATSRMGSRSA